MTKMPPRFTGKFGDNYYYKGILWFGPSNYIGYMPNGAVLEEIGPGKFALYPKGSQFIRRE